MYYCVTSTFDDYGNVTAKITNQIEADKIPNDIFTNTLRKDIYNDWFDDLNDAQEFVKESRLA
ncbi:MAG: hypothetical protein IJ571_06060 [Ruminococcus sp.]|nr:hypothetical protein [Ruminococcus sp.]